MTVIVGAGLTGLTAAYTLTRAGHECVVYERDFTVGGHSRSESMLGVPYEPHGAHIFHTEDAEVWSLVTSLVSMLPYRHRVLTDVEGQMYSWPIQLEELHRLHAWPRIERELGQLTGEIDSTNFETWSVSQMGETLFGLFIDGYTTKQWGRPARELSADMGPKRVELRRDGVRDLFRDRFQGWPANGYGELAEALAADVQVCLGQPLTLRDIPDLAAPGEPVIVTAALDDFVGGPELEWRGVNLIAQWQPHTVRAQRAMVVNRPDPDVPYTRTIETKHVLSDHRRSEPGTVVMFEYPGAPAKHYPVPDARGVNRQHQETYEAVVARYERNPIIPAGRLARYTYINMDQAMREGMNAAAEALR